MPAFLAKLWKMVNNPDAGNPLPFLFLLAREEVVDSVADGECDCIQSPEEVVSAGVGGGGSGVVVLWSSSEGVATAGSLAVVAPPLGRLQFLCSP